MNQASTGARPRAVAARALDAVLTNGRNLDKALADSGVGELSERDRSLAVALAYGAVRTHLRNQALIALLADRPIRRRDSLIVALLSVGLYALTDAQQPEYAIVSSTVAAAPKVGQPRAKTFINALLRRYIREREQLLATIEGQEPAHWLHPEWLISRLRQDWPQHWQEVLQAGNRQAPMWLRVNCLRQSREQWLEEADLGVPVQPPVVPTAILLPEPMPVNQIPGFASGACSVQDVASQVAAELLAPRPGMRVLDACAAPGGKASHLLEHSPDLKELVALDVSGERLQRVTENLQRLGLSARVTEGDARHPDNWWDDQPFDRILVDAPCSATGVIRRHPDIRFLRHESDIAALAVRQREMLEALWPLLCPGGRLLYSTCSVLREENECVVQAFLLDHADARVLDVEPAMPAEALAATAVGGQLLPGRIDNDGFYYALIERTSDANA